MSGLLKAYWGERVARYVTYRIELLTGKCTFVKKKKTCIICAQIEI